MSVIFAAAQTLVKASRAKDVQLLQSEDGIKALNKLANDYVNFCKECCMYASRDISRPEPLQFDAEHYRKLYTCFSLFSVLYLPEPGFEDVPVGDELMEWLNTHFIEPSTQEGDDLSSLAQQLSPLLTDHPRLNNFNAERDFAVASRRWKGKVKTLRIELDRVPESEREDGFENWWDRFSDIVGILEGREDVIKKVCLELGADWKEVCAAWGIFVDTRLRRQDLPEVVSQILDEMPSDPTDLEDVVHSSLFLGRPAQALSEAARLDVWLAAHFADLMEPMELIDSEPDDSELTLRQQYVLAYAEYLRSDPALWRITVDYMYSCGDIGREMGDQVLMRVPLRLKPLKDADNGEEAARIRSGQLAGALKDIHETCFEYKREEIRRLVCKVAAQTFIQEKEYGLAISYITSAEDWPGLGRVVDLVLEEYVLVANIAPSLHNLPLDSAARSSVPAVFQHRLMFAVRFAEFHQRRASGDLAGAASDLLSMFREETAPKSWWAVLLCDAVELLQYNETMLFPSSDACVLIQRLEEIQIRVGQGAGDDYLSVLARIANGGEKHAMQRLQTVRLALARYYARCGAIGVGGRPSGWSY
ncbi:hypothetical protein GSI_13260 [Ganoderma sinense ZZ0214-1]|uniref:Nuclear pore complex protein Nup85 n=1 Tax=Ganoderma sinense ZZ0214-1 TaxID=1077348 RepID=A0A2G8RV31_9APHY|nr:hypothetical protein GSI_13260 [Ganoderma sinense ZZ0214-1]